MLIHLHVLNQTSLHKLSALIRVHTVVQVRGAGTRHSGKYYVTGVKHSIDATNHKMEIELARNGIGSEGGGVHGLLSSIF